ncbi:hypothetical protein HPB51_025567 [Rhipicephalus microplus]|uniref:Uncharacterized protein n=1 Tax=Rhipicephalus microplus TaxID=6941 RepID=A0A9J6F9S6_RHIMP|nr:hypothetical protein HPB51_025567 [Rhipicephalus microplus]
MRGKQWSTVTIKKGLKLRLACGSKGYNAVRELAVPLPSERTLQRRVENCKFSPGILHEVLKFLALKTQSFLCIHAREDRGVMDVEWPRASLLQGFTV